MDSIKKFKSKMASEGIVTHAEIIPDGELHRFHVEGDTPGSKDGFYVLYHNNDIYAGMFGSWQINGGEQINWWSKSKEDITVEEYQIFSERISKSKKLYEDERNTRQSIAKGVANRIWGESKPVINEHPYLVKKGIEGFNIRISSDNKLIVPLFGSDKEIHSLQFISSNGVKRFLSGGKILGKYFLIGEIINKTDRIYICEGYATCMTIRYATECVVVCAFNCGNLLHVTREFKSMYSEAEIIIAADNDQYTNGNPGLTKAREISSIINAKHIYPDFRGFDVTEKPTDFNDLMRLGGVTEVKKQLLPVSGEMQKSVFSKNDLLPHEKILDQLLTKIMPINYRMCSGLGGSDKLLNSHFQIVTIEKILELAKSNNWGICRNHDFIYLFNGGYWSLLDVEDLKVFLGESAEKMGVDKFKAKYFNFREQLYKQFIALANLPKPTQPKDVVFVNLRNGTFKITPNETCLQDFSRNDFITYQLPFDYDPIATAPLFKSYLDRVLPRQELQDILSEYLGYVFIRPNTLKLEKTLLLYGTGANGKSVFYEVVRNLLGEQNTSEYSLQSLTNDNGYYRAMIANKLVNYASEINGKLEASIFKQLVSGEPVEARLPYGNPFMLSQYAKLIFNCNELPKDVEQTEAYFRRFLIIPFNVTIPESEQDRQLAQKIVSSELSGVLNWVLKGLSRLLMQKNFTESMDVCAAREKYKIESDSVSIFIDEAGYKSDHSGYITIKQLYPEYRAFCLDDGNKPVNKMNFIKRLENRKIVIEKRNIGKVAFLIKYWQI